MTGHHALLRPAHLNHSTKPSELALSVYVCMKMFVGLTSEEQRIFI